MSNIKSQDHFSGNAQRADENNCEEIFRKMRESYDDHKIDQAFKLSAKYKKACKGNRVDLSTE